jgi:hypothetical protein
VDVPVVAKLSHDPGFSRYYFETDIPKLLHDILFTKNLKRVIFLIKEKAEKC